MRQKNYSYQNQKLLNIYDLFNFFFKLITIILLVKLKLILLLKIINYK